MSDAFIKLGKVGVHTTENKGHDPEFWARQQALAFKNTVYDIVLRGIRSGIASDRTTVVNLLRGQGHGDMADIIKEL